MMFSIIFSASFWYINIGVGVIALLLFSFFLNKYYEGKHLEESIRNKFSLLLDPLIPGSSYKTVESGRIIAYIIRSLVKINAKETQIEILYPSSIFVEIVKGDFLIHMTFKNSVDKPAINTRVNVYRHTVSKGFVLSEPYTAFSELEVLIENMRPKTESFSI